MLLVLLLGTVLMRWPGVSACPTTIHIRHGGTVTVEGRRVYCPYRARPGEQCATARHLCMCYPHAYQDTYDYCVLHSGWTSEHCCAYWEREWYCNRRWLRLDHLNTTTSSAFEFIVQVEDNDDDTTPRPAPA